MLRQERIVGWLATVLPLKIAEAPERVLINVMCVLIGAAVLLSDQSGRLWPPVVSYVWAVMLIVGGAAALVGYWRNPSGSLARPLERLGYLVVGAASLAYGVRALWVVGWAAVPIAGIFLGIAFAKAVRLLVSSAARDSVLRSGEARGERS